MKLPNFLIVGAAKSGTTSMYMYLGQCKDIFLPAQKELRYFCNESLRLSSGGKNTSKIFNDIVSTQSEYEQFYLHATNSVAVGEITPQYLYYHHEAIPKIKTLLGDPLIFIFLRNPVERAYSQYKHLVRDLREDKPFEQVLLEEEQNKEKGYELGWHLKSLGLYYMQVKAYMDNFSKVRIYIYEEWKSDLGRLANEVLRELGLATITWPKQIIENRSGVPKNKGLQRIMKSCVWRNTIIWRNRLFPFIPPIGLTQKVLDKNLRQPKMKESTRKYLCDYFRADVRHLSGLLQRDLSLTWFDE